MVLEEVKPGSWAALTAIAGSAVALMKFLFARGESANAALLDEHKKQIDLLAEKVSTLEVMADECEVDRANLRTELAVLKDRVNRNE